VGTADLDHGAEDVPQEDVLVRLIETSIVTVRALEGHANLLRFIPHHVHFVVLTPLLTPRTLAESRSRALLKMRTVTFPRAGSTLPRTRTLPRFP
jgi:hypothetical protein